MVRKVRKEAKNKEIDEKADFEVEKLKKKNEEKQLKWILIVMAFLIFLAIFIYIAMDSMRKFEYAGLKFEKIMYDQLPLFQTKLPMLDSQGNLVANYNLFLRNDPRKLRDIKINGTIMLMKKIVVSFDPDIEECEDKAIALPNMKNLFSAFGMEISPAYTDESYAKERKVPYMTCDDSENQSVIIIEQGNKNKITQESSNCYTIEFKDCEVNKAVERFMIGAIAQSKGIEI